jgi:hypothetical protein
MLALVNAIEESGFSKQFYFSPHQTSFYDLFLQGASATFEV